MSRKDFILIAQVIKYLPSFECKQDSDVVRHRVIVASFAEALKNTNPRFDAQRFTDAATGKRSL
ncbi:MAG TPA: hypothetical protein VHV29_10340 [Terriglobales bacterium]|jgi:hypothetical protein|nr:hypothetical protein [Terriglobales bacterium]